MGNCPLALAMVISDAIWVDPATGKKTILGIFSAILGRQFPLVLPQLAIYVAVTDARGKVRLTLRLIDADELRDPVYEKTFDEVDFQDPRMVAEMVALVHGLKFDEPGEYRLQLWGEDDLVLERRIVVAKAETANA
jgi:hypothetical protein